MTNEKEVWIRANEAAKLLGYKNAANVNKLARAYDVRVKKGPRSWHLYNKKDLLLAHEKIDLSAIPTKHLIASFAKFNTHLHLPVPQMVIADVHNPYGDWLFLEQALRVKDRLGVGNLVLAGDTMDCGAQSKFYSIIKADWEVEKEITQKWMKRVLREWDSVSLLTANHELRYIKTLWQSYDSSIVEQDSGERLDVWQVGLQELIKKENLKISIYPYADIGETWRVSHPSSYRKQPLSFGREQFMITGKSQIITHAHMSAWSPAPDGEHHLVDCGCFSDPLHFPFKNLRVTAHYRWTESFVIVDEDEWPRIYMKGNTKPINEKVG